MRRFVTMPAEQGQQAWSRPELKPLTAGADAKNGLQANTADQTTPNVVFS